MALVIHNARVLTMDPGRPRVDAVLVRDGLIVAAGSEAEVRGAAPGNAEALDVDGRVLLPGFIDAHIHLLGYAARLLSVDCADTRSITGIQALVGEAARRLPGGAWVRAAGYDEALLAERRHPTRHDLDAAAPEHPVRLQHRGGHAVVLNTMAMRMAGIDASTPEPPGGYMERDLDTGEPTGLLFEMGDVVDRAVPPIDEAELRGAAAEAGRRLLEAGITCFEDATATNGPNEWRLLAGLQSSGALPQRVSMMEGFGSLATLPKSANEGRLTRGPVEIMPRELEHEFHPDAEGLARMLREVTAAGRKAAVHAVTRDGLRTVLKAFEALGASASGHRVEHCGICGIEEARRLAVLGVGVVTQPSFLYWSGDSFAHRVTGSDLPDLYPLRRLLDAGVAVAGSSDAPIVPPDRSRASARPSSAAAARDRNLAPAQAIRAEEAMALYTSRAAEMLGMTRERGRIAPGLAADFVVLGQDPTAPEVDWGALRVEMTIIAGRPR